MSIEKNIYVEQNSPVTKTPFLDEVKFSGRVDINHLLARARKVKERENKINLIFIGMIIIIVCIIGIILSF